MHDVLWKEMITTCKMKSDGTPSESTRLPLASEMYEPIIVVAQVQLRNSHRSRASLEMRHVNLDGPFLSRQLGRAVVQRGVILTQEIGAGVLRYISQKFGDQSMVRLLLLHVDPVRSSIVASPPPRTAADKALVRSFSHFNESSPSGKLRALYQEMLKVSKIALGTPFLQASCSIVYVEEKLVPMGCMHCNG